MTTIVDRLVAQYGEPKVGRLLDIMYDTPVSELIDELLELWTPEYMEQVMANIDTAEED